MIHSLVGVSEALVFSGSALIIHGFNTVGMIMIGLGAVSGLAKWGFNVGIINRQLESED